VRRHNAPVPAAAAPTHSLLYGRAREIELLTELISRGKAHGQALVIRGDPGIGKSALLAAASTAARANGFEVLAATGVQSEAELPFAGLHQLMHALPWDGNTLPGPQRDAVRTAFGMSSASTPDPFLIALATLGLLADAAARSPLLVIAEDAHWLDRPTSNVLTFVARRLEADPIVMLFAVREGGSSALLEAGLTEIRLAPLGDEDAASLLDAQAPNLAPAVRKQILQEACGNPLALVELPTALTSGNRLEIDSIQRAPLQLTARLESAFMSRFVELPEATRASLLIAALDDGTEMAEILAAAGLQRHELLTVDVLGPAESARLIDLSPGEVRFRHPLVRSAIQQSATLADRVAGHAALAGALKRDLDRRAWHRAAAVIGRSEEVAGDLDALAARARARGAVIVSISALQRAADLTPDPARRGERLLRAAEHAFEVGQRDTVAAIVQQAEPLMALAHGPLERARMALVRGLGQERVLKADRLESLVSIAAEARSAGDANLAWNLLWRLAQRCFWADPGPEARSIIVSAAEQAESADHDAREVAVQAYAAPIERANVVIDRVANWPVQTANPEEARLLGSAAVVVGAFELSLPLLAVAVSGLRQQGRLAHLARALAMQGWSALCLADWKTALPALDEAHRMATETNEAVWAAGARAVQSIVAAVLGEPDVAAELATEAERAVISTGATHMLAYIQVARGLAALGDGRAGDAYEELRRIYDTSDPAHHRVPSCWYIGELAEAGARSGHVDEARAFIRELESLVANCWIKSSWIQSAFSYAHAQVADDENAETRFHEALVLASRWPFQRARLQLAYGAWLRRQRRAADARAPLRSARDAFDALAIPAWADRARKELRAAGEASRSRAPEVWDRLSPQEMQIANMAAEGLSNREIAQRLYLSHRTVGSHLYRLFPKLGVTSRSQLVAALART
jgi:DNA-binding CsgD family transcriptional regulator